MFFRNSENQRAMWTSRNRVIATSELYHILKKWLFHLRWFERLLTKSATSLTAPPMHTITGIHSNMIHLRPESKTFFPQQVSELLVKSVQQSNKFEKYLSL